jgi:hypothetical protein
MRPLRSLAALTSRKALCRVLASAPGWSAGWGAGADEPVGAAAASNGDGGDSGRKRAKKDGRVIEREGLFGPFFSVQVRPVGRLAGWRGVARGCGQPKANGRSRRSAGCARLAAI